MIPPNIKEEIEKEAQEYTKAYEDEWFTIRDCYLKAATQFYIRDCYLKAATQFYLKGVGDSRWVSIEEKLPEYLTTVMLYENDECWWGYYGHDKRFHYFFGDIIREDKIFTHWQPVPKKPEDLK
jgi:hypothetical protein